jgi:N-acetylglutamate synthase-like GNAT family acetyltransferase
MTVEIRRFAEDDAVPASRIIHTCFTTMNLGDYTPEGIISQLQDLSPEKLVENSKTMKLFVAVADGVVVGIGGYNAEKIRTVFVTPPFHRKGIGSLIVSRVLSDARQNGIKQLECWSTPFAEPFYSKLGFKKAEILDWGTIRFVRMTINL